MDEIRLINANEIPNFEYTAIQKCGDIETPCKFRIAHWKDIADMPTIDPETLPIVRELREENQKLKDKLFEWDYWEGNTKKQILDSAKEDRASVNHIQKYCEKTIAELREKLERVTAERDAAVMDVKTLVFGKIKACSYCMHNDPENFDCPMNKNLRYCDSWEWCGLQKEESNEK